MGEPARKPMTADEFLAWDDGTDQRYELVDGQIVAMAPPSDPHGTIAVNAATEIDRRLEARAPCRAVVEAGIQLDDANHYKADVAATWTQPRGSPFVEDPFLIVEVLSESTERHDLATKVQRYIELPSAREIWLVDSRKRWVQVWRRAADTWVVSLPMRANATFVSEALGDQVELDRLYRNTGL
ncbi:MAG TPA: Uma2 family endonuclease [Geminicoccaceae bacterium]|nr:Uma2 family endonuclease [Geminicoccaceae bacterium]